MEQLAKRIIVFILLIVIAQLWPVEMYGQFDRILKRTGQKLEHEIERMAVEKASDIIARQIAKKMEESFDEWLREAAEKDTSFHYEEGDSSAYRMGRAYGDFLRGMNDAADLPPSYHFDIQLLVEIQQGKEDPEQMLMLFSKSEPVFAMQTSSGKDQTQIILMDIERDATVLYTEEDGKKSGQAIPSFSSLAGAGNQELEREFHFSPTGKTEKIAGYHCKGYEGYSVEHAFEFWNTDDLDINWNESFAAIMEKFGGSSYAENYKELKGVTLKSLSWEKSDKKKKDVTRWETLEVITKAYEIVNADYSFGYQNKNADE